MEAEKISVELDSRFHLFRNESEISKESKGGYLRGRIRLPPSAATATDYYLELSLVYGLDNMDDINPQKITPCLIYLKGDEKKGKKRDLTNKDWEIAFRKEGCGLRASLRDGTDAGFFEVDPDGSLFLGPAAKESNANGGHQPPVGNRLRLNVIKASQKSRVRSVRTQSLEGVLRDRLKPREGEEAVDQAAEAQLQREEQLRLLVGKFKAAKKGSDPRAAHVVRLRAVYRACCANGKILNLVGTSDLILDSNSQFTRKVELLGLAERRKSICERGETSLDVEVRGELDTKALRAQLWAVKTAAGSGKKELMVLKTDLRVAGSRIELRGLPTDWLSGVVSSCERANGGNSGGWFSEGAVAAAATSQGSSDDDNAWISRVLTAIESTPPASADTDAAVTQSDDVSSAWPSDVLSNDLSASNPSGEAPLCWVYLRLVRPQTGCESEGAAPVAVFKHAEGARCFCKPLPETSFSVERVIPFDQILPK